MKLNSQNDVFTLKNISPKLIIDSKFDDTKYFRVPLTKTYSGIMILDSSQVVPSKRKPGRFDITFSKSKLYTFGQVSLKGKRVGEITGSDVGVLFSKYIELRRKNKIN